MAPRRVVLLLLVAAAAACSGLLAPSSAPAVVHAARHLPHCDDVVPAAETTTGFQPLTVDADGALRGVVMPHLIHPTVLADGATDDPAIQRTVYDVTVVFRATARLGPPRLQYYVVPADASVPISGGAGDTTNACDGSGVFTFSQGLLMGAILAVMSLCILGACFGNPDKFSHNGATPKNPEVVLAEAAGGAKACGCGCGGN